MKNPILKSEINLLMIVGLIGAGLYFFLPKKKNEVPEAGAEPDTVETNPIAPKPTAPKPIVLDKNLILAFGSKGNEVKFLQNLLSFKYKITVDGIFGNQTRTALFAEKGIEKTSINQYYATPSIMGVINY